MLLFEDGAQGFGSLLHGRKACSFGDIAATSFFPAKPLGCYGAEEEVDSIVDEIKTILENKECTKAGRML